MKILLDECLPARLRKLLAGHEVFTVGYMNWKSISNGRLLELAAAHAFDCLLTVDKGTLDQLPSPPLISVLVVRVKWNTYQALAPLIPEILSALAALPPRSIQHLD